MCVRRQIHHQARSNFANTIYGAKRLIGRKHDEPEVLQEMKLLPFRVVKVCVCVCVCVCVRCGTQPHMCGISDISMVCRMRLMVCVCVCVCACGRRRGVAWGTR
jgi:Hsp70 protein